MMESLRRAVLIGMGAASMSWDRVRHMIDDMVARGDMTAEEGRKLFQDLTSRAEEEGRSLNDRMRATVRDTLKDMGVADRGQVALLESRIDALERRIEQLTVGHPKPETPEG